ncbi:FAD-binding oxidoreductase [Kitasatospora purpeofusca]|uniref:FAD-binding oxidoreductase n=1 Tax=Kitasatospora purpeofusca TaxID=67352 RepID=UPI0036D40569
MLRRRSVLLAGAAAAALTAAGPAVARPRGNWDRLRASLQGDVLVPGDAGYDKARQSHFLQFDYLRPQAVAFCETPADVRKALSFAHWHDLHTVPRSGGHSYAGYSTNEGLILDVSRLNRTTVGASTVTLGPGAQQVDALAAVDAHGLALPSGLCPTVCPGGFLQGGGIGWLTRRAGVATDRLVSADVVLADGRFVHCSEYEHPDLFWALRGGGGGNFGVVTRFEVRPIKIPTMVNYNLTWPWEQAATVIEAWQDWMIGGSRDLGGALGIQWVDAGTGHPDVLVYGGFAGNRAAFDQQLAALVSAVGTQPTTSAVAEKPYRQAMMQWYGCQDLDTSQCHRIGYLPESQLPRQTYSLDRNRMVSRAIPAEGIRTILDNFTAAPRAGQFRYISIFALGGAANDLPRDATAYVHRTTELYVANVVGLSSPTATEDDRTAARAWVTSAFDAIDPYSNGEGYQNFIDSLLDGWQSAYYAENYARLSQVKRSYDPERFFRFAQAIR